MTKAVNDVLALGRAMGLKGFEEDVAVAAGGAAAFTAIESKMGQPFAQGPDGRASWLQRNNADGSQTRAYPTMGNAADKMSALSGELGSSAICLSVTGIPLSEFSLHTSSGAVPKGSRAPVTFMSSDVPDSLRRALGR